jgi:aconitate hydratase
MLRRHGVVGKFVEFYGPAVASLPMGERCTIANMAPEYGATCGLFPIDQETLGYLRLTGRGDDEIALVEAYARAQGMFHTADSPVPRFSETLRLDLGDVVPSLAGPKRPQDRVALSDIGSSFPTALAALRRERNLPDRGPVQTRIGGQDVAVRDGSVVIAAITSCTNTSNPSVMLAAGLVAKKAVARGLRAQPGSRPRSGRARWP